MEFLVSSGVQEVGTSWCMGPDRSGGGRGGDGLTDRPAVAHPFPPAITPLTLSQVLIFCVNKRKVVQEYMARSKWPSSVVVRTC